MSVTAAPLSIKRSWRVASEDFDCTLKILLFVVVLTPPPAREFLFITKKRSGVFVCGCFNSSPRRGAPLYYKKAERFFVGYLPIKKMDGS